MCDTVRVGPLFQASVGTSTSLWSFRKAVQTSKETDIAGVGRLDDDRVRLCRTSLAEKSQQSQEFVEGDGQLH